LIAGFTLLLLEAFWIAGQSGLGAKNQQHLATGMAPDITQGSARR